MSGDDNDFCRYAELENFTSLEDKSMQCDVTIDEPTILIKLDAGQCLQLIKVQQCSLI